ncbi:exosortase-dependent surface protein XDP1 [Massilia sp. H6]|uniref:exosortase-dependent surface protein XDP1 n=1 Tax=Massilia sp. H6 TaxID=2970464 RepID=UPI00216789E9|nr:exosortase-dependent surface protein XDP1 [Massilia sp. H6]UVW28431.1 PEP-CTERM sorting domain-containing protein [Massilia sp. H6]
MKSSAILSLGSLALSLAISGNVAAGPVWNAASCVASKTTPKTMDCKSAAPGPVYSAALSGWSAAGTANFAAADIKYYGGGLGVSAKGESGSPQHAIDNKGGTDAVLMYFDTNFALKQLSTGWINRDADVSILRYTGTAPLQLGASRVNNLLAVPGWELVGNYSTLTKSTPLNFNDTNKTASWWLVSAYNSAYNGVAASGALNNNNDYFKLNGFKGEVVPNEVPEPATWSLVGLALLGIGAARRKARLG